MSRRTSPGPRPSRHAPGRTGRSRTGTLLAVVLLSAGLAGSATPAAGQISFGLHGVSANDAFGGTLGVGGRLAFTLPLFPVEFLASAETFFPDQDDASLRGASLDVALDLLPLPVVTPYATGGLTFRQVDLGFGEGSETNSGLNVGAGLKIALAGFGVFGEARYEFVNAPEKQGIVRVGVMFGG